VIKPPYLFGDNRGVILAPFNVGYTGLKAHLETCELEISEENIKNFTLPVQSKIDKHAFAIMDPEEFTSAILPISFKESELILTPVEYKQIINLRNSIFKKVQDKIGA